MVHYSWKQTHPCHYNLKQRVVSVRVWINEQHKQMVFRCTLRADNIALHYFSRNFYNSPNWVQETSKM